MKRDVKWMLLGIFLAVASCWCLLFAVGSSDAFWTFLCYALPIAAVITFATGFTGVDESKSHETENTDVPKDTENKE